MHIMTYISCYLRLDHMMSCPAVLYYVILYFIMFVMHSSFCNMRQGDEAATLMNVDDNVLHYMTRTMVLGLLSRRD